MCARDHFLPRWPSSNLFVKDLKMTKPGKFCALKVSQYMVSYLNLYTCISCYKGVDEGLYRVP